MKLVEELEKARDEMISWRRHLHEHPEVAYNEKDTADFVAAKLESFGVEVHRGFGGTGLVGVIRGKSDGGSIGLRADMDALPMSEETNLPYASKRPGAMHACGHDGHTTMLLGLLLQQTAAAGARTQQPHVFMILSDDVVRGH